MTIYYPVPEILLEHQARFIQIVNTAHALAYEGWNVKLITGRSKHITGETILRSFNLKYSPNLQFIFLPILRNNIKYLPVSSNAVFELSLLHFLWRSREDKGVVFVRHPKLAKFIIMFKFLFKMPVLFEAHEIFHYNCTGYFKRLAAKNTQRYISQRADGLIATNEHLRKEIIEAFSIRQIPVVTISNAVRRDIIEDVPQSSFERGKYIFYCGGLYTWKGVDTAIEAMRYLPQEKLMIVGSGSRLLELKALAKALNVKSRVIFTGRVSQKRVISYLMSAKVALIPNLPQAESLYSSPLKMFEYMAAGVPIVASRLSPILDVLKEGESVLCFKPGDSLNLADTIKRLIDDKTTAKKFSMRTKQLAAHYTYNKRAELITTFIKGYIDRDLSADA
ncbi:group 1 glycosyl transferase [Candidatus Magnetoovum chiemensis]|nr:group 1 glycosyl transferase [Candidatus Magnetoovum chiemensis]